ncbi:GntR family transcriptional regulator [Aeromonas veronii]
MTIEIKRPYQEVGQFLRNQLLDEQYQVGDRLPPERDIAEQLGVGRTVVREALIMLELENLVEVRKGSGVYVIQLPQPKNNESLNVPQSIAGPFEMLQARQLLESNIAEFAALQATPHDISKMRKALEIERQDLISGEGEEGDHIFHLAIAEATQIVCWLSYLNSLGIFAKPIPCGKNCMQELPI